MDQDGIETLRAVRIRLEYILRENKDRSDGYKMKKDVQEICDEIRNREKQEELRA